MGKKKLLESRCSPSYIHDMMSTLSKNNSVEKLAEIDLIGFGFLILIPNCSVKQVIMVHLAESYQVKPRTFILDIGNIRLNAELIGKGRLIEDMAKVAMPAYEHTENGLPHFYASVPQQDNGCDCGVFVIKFMQFWGLDKPLQHWDQDVVQEFRKEIILDIVMGPA
ncbi:hypothetical protein AHAS_Ahas13G0061900 [Arachis hypogaea]